MTLRANPIFSGPHFHSPISSLKNLFDEMSANHLTDGKTYSHGRCIYLSADHAHQLFLYENGTYPLYCFKLLKRGQNEPGRFHYQLSDFGRIVTAYYYNAPGEARSSPTQVIVRYSDTSSEYDTVEFSESDPSKPIYAPFDLYDDKAALFLSWYKPVNFAVSISEVYRLVEKQYRNAATPDANTLAVLANGRYFFVAYVVNALNHAGKPLTAERSFANFDYSADHVKCAKEYIIELILQYSTLVRNLQKHILKTTAPAETH